jgi:hypothetical protein
MDQKLQEQQEEDLFDDIEEDDYIFIIDKKGKLKACFIKLKKIRSKMKM